MAVILNSADILGTVCHLVSRGKAFVISIGEAIETLQFDNF